MEIETTPTAMVLVEQLTPPQLFAPGALNPILERIKAEVRAIETDISTEDGRKAIASLAYKVARTKSFIESQRLQLVGDEKRRLAAIDAEGKRVRDQLDALRDEVRAPLNEWEEAERKRLAGHEKRVRLMFDLEFAFLGSLSAVDLAAAQLDELWNHSFEEFNKRATQAHERALLHLQSSRANIIKAEAERAEKARLKAEMEEKARAEREAKIAEDARLKAEAEAKRREDALALAAKQREEQFAQAAANEKARLEKSLAEAKEKGERERNAAEERERQAEAEHNAAAKKAEDARRAAERKAVTERVEAAERAERKREEAVAAERKRQEDALVAIERERRSRAEDRAHRETIHAMAVNHLVACTIERELAKVVIDVIARGLIPGVSISY